MTDKPKEENLDIRQKLNLETGKLSWPELQRHFARGVVICVDPGLDLIEVAAAFTEDNQVAVKKWMDQGKVTRATDDHAKRWDEDDAVLWAVVVAPWVVVQEIQE